LPYCGPALHRRAADLVERISAAQVGIAPFGLRRGQPAGSGAGQPTVSWAASDDAAHASSARHPTAAELPDHRHVPEIR
jgi:hypothetical protein